MKKPLALLVPIVLIAVLAACANGIETPGLDIHIQEAIVSPIIEPVVETEKDSETEESEKTGEIILIITGRYGQGTPESNEAVRSILGTENSRERFNVYFNWYNISPLAKLSHRIFFA